VTHSGSDDTLLLTGGTVVTMDAARHVFDAGTVAIVAGEIVAVGPVAEVAARFPDAPAHDCTGCAVIPGLVNGHTHVPMSLLRGFAADQRLDAWLADFVFPVEQRFVDADFVRTGAMLSAAEMIRGGITTFVDMYYFPEEVARVVDETGLRAICGQGVLRGATPDAADGDAGLARAERFMADWQGHPRVTPTVAPHAPYTCDEAIFRQAAALCERYGGPLITHLSETAGEVATSRAAHGASPVGWMASLGAFDVPFIAAHCVHVDDDDIGRLAERGVGVVPCPTSNLKLASGVAPYARLLAANVRLGLGTDGPASNDDQDLWTELHLAALLPKGLSGDPTAVPAPEALALATSRGADAIHLGDRIGSLAPGKRADITVVALDGLHTSPRYRHDPEAIYRQLVYSTHAADVRDVLVDGRWLLRDGVVLTVDVPAARAKAQTVADRVDGFLAENRPTS
jgi:5-methylthioadenosine/S-adenosylhomocysteine deaminase